MTATTYQWQPSTAQVAARAGIPVDRVIRFDHNTSPRPTDWVEPVLAAASPGLNEYPAADYAPLRHAIEAYSGVEGHRVVPGAGADELISLCARAFLRPGDTAVGIQPSYTLYRVATEQHHATFVAVEAHPPRFSFPWEGLAATGVEPALVWLCVPNNPTGERPDDAALTRFLDATPGVVVIDAAYAEFCGDRWSEVVLARDNVVVLQTLSKAFGLAGIRVGYALAAPELAARLEAVRPPGSISTTSAAVAVAALERPQRATELVARIEENRTVLAGRLRDVGLRVLPSVTNFLLCEVGPGAHRLEAAMMAEGLVVRAYRSGPLVDFLRFTVRTAADHDRLIDALERNLP